MAILRTLPSAVLLFGSCGLLAPAYAAGVLVFASEQAGTEVVDGLTPGLRSLSQDFLPEEASSFESLSVPASKGKDSSVDHRFSMVGYRGERNEVLLPFYRQEATQDQHSYTRLDAWGIKWQHRLASDHSFALAAHRSSNLYMDSPLGSSTTSTMASFSWSSDLKGRHQSRITGSVFYGDESAVQQVETGPSGRRYYGLSVGGEFTVFRDHTPYLSLKLQKSDLAENEVDAAPAVATDDSAAWGTDFYSRVSAGWSWKVDRNWSLKAEANYSFNDTRLDWRFDQNRVFFGTRYDFR